MTHDVFISHSTRDKAVSDAVCAALEKAGVRCWVAPRDVQPGRSFAGEITRAIQQSRVMVLIFSAHSNNSEQVLREVQLAVESHLHIIQFRIQDVRPNDDLKYFLSTPHWLDALTPPLENHIRRLEPSVKTLLKLPNAEPVESVQNDISKSKPIPETKTVSEPRSRLVENVGAITGSIFILFLGAHLIGNLGIFFGPDWINGYSQHLHDFGPPRWALPVFVLVCVIIHINATNRLDIKKRSRRAITSSLVVLAFILYHLAHFTLRKTDSRFELLKPDPFGHYDVYSMMVYGFQNYFVSAFYVLGLFFLALYVIQSSSIYFHSLALNDKKLTRRLALGARIFAWLLFTSYTSIPIAILLGLIRPAQQL